MKYITRVSVMNLIVLVIYTLIINLLSQGSERGLAVMMGMAFAVGLHTTICFIAMLYWFVNKQRDKGRAWLLASGLVLVIGFSACLGTGNMNFH